MIKSEYQTWRDELAGKRQPLVKPWEWVVFAAGWVVILGVAFTHHR